MKYMTHNEIRNMWFSFFLEKEHRKEESASLIPVNDDSLLWINAGVAPLKKYFDGTEVPKSKRIMNIQKCIRTNDIENVGITKRHQTFFEMMGNFSIGDYFKDEAIEYAFELLTSSKWFSIPRSLLYVTYYPDDLDCYNKWIEVGLPEDHLIPLEENFWEIGEGPCGPDSEIFFDRGIDYDPDGDAFEKFKKDEEQERYVEIWNNVFSQFNSKLNVPRNKYKELPHKNIDTGAGLERWCIIFQGVDSSFETDLFQPIIKHIEELADCNYVGQMEIKVIADHIRAITFALADGAGFSNVGRGYVLRRLLRRSVRFGKRLNIETPFMYKIVSDVIDVMKESYPYLVEKRAQIEALVLEEEKLFIKTLDAGLRRLKELVDDATDGIIHGDEAFKLYDTYGFPIELTEEYLEELGYKVDKEEFLKYMQMQKEMARKSNKNKTSMASQKQVLLDFTKESKFVYGIYRLKSNVLACFSKDKIENKLNKDGYIALKRTCFYAESGGQVGDTGMIIGKNFKARVVDVFKGPNGQHIHKVRLLDGIIHENDDCELVLDKDRRKRIEANHSSVHLLQYALQQVVSKDIKQAGSYVDADKFRFDFTYSGKLTDEKIIEVEDYINKLIKQNIIVSTEIMPLDAAKEIGAMALFGEKYNDVVRVVKIGKSIELCGGCHAANTKDIGSLAIVSYESKGSNVYRISGATGEKIDSSLFEVIKPYNNEKIKLLMKAKEMIDEAREMGIKLVFDVNIEHSKTTSYKDLIFEKNELQYVQDEVHNLEKTYFKEREKRTLENLDIYKEKIRTINGIKTLVMKVENKDNDLLKSIADNLINTMHSGFIFFANINDDSSVTFLARSNSLIHAGYMVKEASATCGGGGGGSKTFGQGGAKANNAVDTVLEYVEKEIKSHV